MVFGRGCTWFAGIVWAHVDANFSTVVLKQKRNSMAPMRLSMWLENYDTARMRSAAGEFWPNILSDALWVSALVRGAMRQGGFRAPVDTHGA